MSIYTHSTVTAATAEETLTRLYQGSALTFEGMTDDPANLDALYKAFQDCGAAPNSTFEFVSVKGREMNNYYGLTGTNAYKNNLTILCCPLSGFDNYSALIFWRLTCGGRWFDDVVDNNARREDAE